MSDSRPHPYSQEDLGYPRIPTDAVMHVTFENGEAWAFPVQIVADNRDKHYADENEDTVRGIAEGSHDDGDLTEWAINNMNWSDVQDYAVQVPTKPTPFDYQNGWLSADREIIGLPVKSAR